MYRKLFVIGLASLMVLGGMVNSVDAQEHITGEYLWIIAPTEAGKGGKDSNDIDSLAAASDNAVTEAMVANFGATEGDQVGDYKWILAELPADGNINVMLNEAGVIEATDMNDVSSYALITLVSAEAQEGVDFGVNSDDSVKVWLNGTVVHNHATNRGRGGANAWQDTFTGNLRAGNNLLMIKVSERTGGWGMYAGIDADVETAYRPAVTHINTGWLWMIAPTEAGQGGENSTDIDSLAVASKDEVTEEFIAMNGANEGDSIGDYDWIQADLPADGNINVMLNTAGVIEATDMNDVSSYALTTIVAEEAMDNVTLGVSSDDSVKVWLNGEVVHNHATNRGRGGAGNFQDWVTVDLKQGDNILLIKVSERTGGWGMYAGIGANVETVYKSTAELGTAVEAAGKAVTTWGRIKAGK